MFNPSSTGEAGANLAKPMQVGPITIANRAFLAPMSGVTDRAFRRLAWRFGAGLVFSEMVASEALVEGNAEMELKVLPSGGPVHAVQLAGRETKWMRLAAEMAEGNGADIIDINMGCPAKRVTTGLAGSALMREPDLALSLIEAVVSSVKVPVYAENAPRLGSWQHECAGTCAAGRTGRRADDHRARPHALPVLQGQCGLGCGACGQGGCFGSRRRQRRHHQCWQMQ